LAGAPHVGGAGGGAGGAGGGAACCAGVVGWACGGAGGAAVGSAALGLGASDGLGGAGVGLGWVADAEVAVFFGGFVVCWGAALIRWVGGGFGRTRPRTVRPPRPEHKVHAMPTVTIKAINRPRRLRVVGAAVCEGGSGGCAVLLATYAACQLIRLRGSSRTVCSESQRAGVHRKVEDVSRLPLQS